MVDKGTSAARQTLSVLGGGVGLVSTNSVREIWGRRRTRTIGASAVEQEIEFDRDSLCGLCFGPTG